MPDTDGAWSPEEAEAAFRAFGNLFLQVTALQRDYGTVNEVNEHAAERLMPYLAELPEATFVLLAQFLGALPELTLSLSGLIELEALRRTVNDFEARRPRG